MTEISTAGTGAGSMPSSDAGYATPRPSARPRRDTAGRSRATRALAWSAAIGIGTAILIMIAASAARNSWSSVHTAVPAAGPPWQLSLKVSVSTAIPALWAAALVGAGGVIAGLAAVRRGARLPVRALLAVGLVATAALTVLPPAGSTDSLDYAAYGRMAVLRRSPYVMTPDQLRRTGDPVGRAAPAAWGKDVSLYGPLATAEELGAAELGGTSAARIVFWLKLWNALAFGAVALALDRLLRCDPSRRARAHLLWTVNPLLLWALIAGAHVDGLAAAAGFLGLIVVGGAGLTRSAGPAGSAGPVPPARLSRPAPPGWRQALASGLLIGAAADIKITFAIFGLGVAWACRRSILSLAAAAAGAVAVLVPSYLWYGYPAVTALSARSDYATADSYYRWLAWPGPHPLSNLLLPVAAFAALAALLLWRLPGAVPALPAIQPALALGLAWLFVASYQLPWYDAMILPLLAIYPASRLDWLVLARLAAGTVALMPGNPLLPTVRPMRSVASANLELIVPLVLLGALIALVWCAVSGSWGMRPGTDRTLS